MIKEVNDHLDTVLHHLYINPLEKCNLKCKICYTRKTDPILSEEEILNFVERYRKVLELQTITFCGGEVFALKYFPGLVNKLTDQGIFVQMITNGTIDKLDEFKTPNSVNLIVSIDGLEPYHDANRGEGNFQKSLNFLKKGKKLGFHTEIFSIVTHQNLPQIDEFEKYMNEELSDWHVEKNARRLSPNTMAREREVFFHVPGAINITYHPRKPPAYLTHHPVSNIVGEVNGFDFLTPTEMRQVMKDRNVFPPKNLGCYQIALVSDGRVYGCCEGVTPIGKIDDPIKELVEQMKKRLETWEKTNTLKGCLGCTQSEFMCGIQEYLHPQYVD